MNTPTAPPAPPTAPVAPIITPSETPPQDDLQQISEAQATLIVADIKAQVQKGTMSQAIAEEAHDQIQTPIDQRAPDNRSEALKELDRAAPPGKETDYAIRYGIPGQDPPPTKELKEFDSTARSWLARAEFSRENGNSVIRAIEQTVNTTRHMNAEQLEQFRQTEMTTLRGLYGDSLEEKLRECSQMVHAVEMQQPGLKNLLQSKGIGDAAVVLTQLIAQSQIWHARRKG